MRTTSMNGLYREACAMFLLNYEYDLSDLKVLDVSGFQKFWYSPSFETQPQLKN